MSRRPSGLLLALAAAWLALVLVPSSIAAPDGGTEPAVGAGDPLDVAFDHVRANAADLGVASADVADLAVTSSYRSTTSGITHVNLNQRYRGLEVFGAHATVNVADDGRVVFVGGALAAGLASSAALDPALDATEAVEAAADGLGLAEPQGLRVLESEGGAAQETVVSRGGISEASIPARLGWQPTKAGLRLAWQLTIDDSSSDSLWNSTVDAETGELLANDDWTDHDDLGDLASRLGRTNLTAQAATVYPVPPDRVFDGSSYRVFRLPDESPNDAPRQLVADPADGLASPFGWHDTDGLPGPEFTITRGNNNHAYLDQDDDEQADFGGSPEGGPGLDFDFPVDFSQHSQAYREAVTTNLFYGCNIIHDVLWRYGFDEASGNFQANNYGRGGTGGDFVRCEAADGSGTNNANFGTPAQDGSPPRMQMFLWPGNQFGRQNEVVVDGVGAFGATWARFGPPATPAGLPGRTLVYVGLGCVAADYPSPAPASWTAVADGGTSSSECPYLQRTAAAEAAGADALVVVDTDDNPPIMGGSFVAAPPTIPTIAVGETDGETIKAAIAAGTTTGNVRKNPLHPGIRDGDFDTGIIFHEYGHGVSNRLTGGLNINCLSGNEQAGEGWSDYYAISLLLNPELDDPQGTRGLVPYVLFQENRAGNGLRPRPYSRDMTIQPFTYDSIKTNGWLANANGEPTSLALPHGLGHGWAAVLWDVTWDLLDKHGFNPNVYEDWDTGGNNRAIQYVTEGLKLQGCGPGLVVARAAILAAADELSDGEDTCTVWSSFARRGLGFSAVQGTTNRNDNDEAFDTAPQCLRGFLPPVNEPYGELNEWDAGETVPLRFTADGYKGLDVLATNSPYSRQVDCETLKPSRVDPAFMTPKAPPIPTQLPGNDKLRVNPQGVFQYNWATLEEWAGTCREVVVTRDDGKQHRAFFSFS